MLIQVRSRDDPQTQGEDNFFFFFYIGTQVY